MTTQRHNPLVKTGKRGAAWSETECITIVRAYLELLAAQRAGIKMNKAALIRTLIAGDLAARSRGSIEAKFMNVSAIRQDAGLEVVKGYKAFGNAQALLRDVLRMSDAEYRFAIKQVRHEQQRSA